MDDYSKESAYEWYYLASLFGSSSDQIRATQITAMLEQEFLEQDVFVKGRHEALEWLVETAEDGTLKPASACQS